MLITLGWPRHQPTLAAGPGLCLRPFEARDVDDVHLAHQDEAMLKYVPVPQPYTRAKAERFALGVSAEMWAEESGCTFAIAETDTGRLLGSVGVPFMDHVDREAQVGYWVAPWGRRRGVATAGLRTLSDWLLTEVRAANILLHIEDENVASVAVARAAGYTRLESQVSTELFGEYRTFREWEQTAPREQRACAEPDWLDAHPTPAKRSVPQPRGRMEADPVH